MKKIVLLLLAALMIFSLCACGGDQVPAAPEEPLVDGTAPVTSTPAAGETGAPAADDTASADTPAVEEDTSTTKGRNKNKKSSRRGSRR